MYYFLDFTKIIMNYLIRTYIIYIFTYTSYLYYFLIINVAVIVYGKLNKYFRSSYSHRDIQLYNKKNKYKKNALQLTTTYDNIYPKIT